MGRYSRDRLVSYWGVIERPRLFQATLLREGLPRPLEYLRTPPIQNIPCKMPVRRFARGTYDRYFRRKMRTRRGRATRTRKASFRTRVKRVVQSQAETKHFDIGVENLQLYHNLGAGVGPATPPTTVTSVQLWFNPWEYIQQGTARFQRIGDKITPIGMSVKLYLANKIDRPNTMHRVIVALMPKTVQGAVTGSALNPFQIPNLYSNNNHMTMPADADKGIKFLYDRLHRMSPQQVSFDARGSGGQKELTKIIKLYIKRKRSSPIIFDMSTGNIVNRPIAIYVVPYEQYSTLQTDNTSSCAGFMRLYYKDM